MAAAVDTHLNNKPELDNLDCVTTQQFNVTTHADVVPSPVDDVTAELDGVTAELDGLTLQDTAVITNGFESPKLERYMVYKNINVLVF